MTLLPAWLLTLALGSTPAAATHGQARSDPIGVHSMLYLTDSFTTMQSMFTQTAALGASTIRLDIELSAVFPEPNGPPDWTGVDDYMRLAVRYHLSVLADLLATPWYLADCPAGVPSDVSYRCPPSDPAVWGRDAGAIAEHTRGAINEFEIINEPDGGWAFYGTPQQYAQLLGASYSAIHRANPNAKVALGGLMSIGPAGRAWMDAVLATTDGGVPPRFDIANIHVRTPPAAAGKIIATWRRYFARHGFRGPLWVTETGYPADPSQQTNPAYRGGARAQARYLTAIIPAMICAGAAKVFVTERDSLTGTFASEGLLQTVDPLAAEPQYRRRPSFYAVRKLAEDRSLARLARTHTRDGRACAG